MGKPFSSELEKLSASGEVAHSFFDSALLEAIKATACGPAYLIGTGGSLSVAEFAACLFDKKGFFGRPMTPLAFLQSNADLRSSSVFIFSASGNNKDVLAAFDAAKARSAAQIVNICANKRSKLGLRASKTPRSFHVSFSLPSGRDGYLATNSLFATAIVIARALLPGFRFEDDVNALLKIGGDFFATHFAARPPQHVVILFSEWGRFAATDLESKLSEAGLSGSMLADYRHFAHGRHNWIDKKAEQTAVVAFSNPDDEELATKTLDKLPSSIRICRFHTPRNGALGAIAHLVTMFGFVRAFGRAVGVDPGRPGVPAYGSTLYHLGPVIRETAKKMSRPFRPRKFDISAAVTRKLKVANLAEDHRKYFTDAAAVFIEKIRLARFGAIVADIDGTILPQTQREGPVPAILSKKLIALIDAGLSIVLATGRGDSIQRVLKKSFPQRIWPQVYVGYLNGAFCLPLDRGDEFNTSCFEVHDVNRIFKRLEANRFLAQHAFIKHNRCQITLRARELAENKAVMAAVKAELDSCQEDCRLVVSQHSVDILPSCVTKVSCIEFAVSLVKAGQKILAVGDCGCHPGNDFELLTHEYSLSVDEVSPSVTSCWNFLPAEVQNVSGTLFYLSRLRADSFGFTIQP